MNTKMITRGAVVAVLYAISTLTLPAYGPLQFRLSEIMTLLAYFDPFLCNTLTIGCAFRQIWLVLLV